MTGEIVGIALAAVLFALFGALRPADRPGRGGCGGCAHGDGRDCGAACPLVEDLRRSPRT